jgi:hypothetical protein
MITDKQGKVWNVIAVTPAGRQKHLEILKSYVYREIDKGLIDGWQLWANTRVDSDLVYMNSMETDRPGKVHKCTLDKLPYEGAYSGFNIHLFWKFSKDPDTIYVRFDDDIVFIEEGAVEKLVNARLEHPEPFMIYANIVNNTVLCKTHQDIGVLGKGLGVCKGERLDPFAHQSIPLVQLVHDTFKARYHAKELSKYYFTDITFTNYDPFSITCLAYFGRDFIDKIPDPDEELWASSIRPRELNRPNMACGNALVVHFAHYTQRPELEKNPGYLDFYRQILTNIK